MATCPKKALFCIQLFFIQLGFGLIEPRKHCNSFPWKCFVPPFYRGSCSTTKSRGILREQEPARFLQQRKPMLLFVLDASLFRLAEKTPALEPLFQLPPRMTARTPTQPSPIPKSLGGHRPPPFRKPFWKTIGFSEHAKGKAFCIVS